MSKSPSSSSRPLARRAHAPARIAPFDAIAPVRCPFVPSEQAGRRRVGQRAHLCRGAVVALPAQEAFSRPQQPASLRRRQRGKRRGAPSPGADVGGVGAVPAATTCHPTATAECATTVPGQRDEPLRGSGMPRSASIGHCTAARAALSRAVPARHGPGVRRTAQRLGRSRTEMSVGIQLHVAARVA